MNTWNAEQLLEWMDGALVRRLTAGDGLPEYILLDGSVRIVGFDRREHLRVLDCTTSCPLEEYFQNRLELYAVDQRPHSLHFALRRLIDCSIPSLQKSYMLGANALTLVRMADAYSALELVRMAPDKDRFTLRDIYLMLQPAFEQMWRRELSARRGRTVWTESDCLDALGQIAEDIFPEACTCFAGYALRICSAFRILGVSSPLYIA